MKLCDSSEKTVLVEMKEEDVISIKYFLSAAKIYCFKDSPYISQFELPEIERLSSFFDKI